MRHKHFSPFMTTPSCFRTQVDETVIINAQQHSQILCSAEPCFPYLSGLYVSEAIMHKYTSDWEK